MNPLQRRLLWALLTLPLPLAALAVYSFLEWLFFVTKVSVVSGLPWGERLRVLVETPAPFIPFVLVVQLPFTLAAVAFPRVRGVAVIPAAILLGCAGFLLADNFTYVLFSFSSTSVPDGFRYVYAVLLLAFIAACGHALARLVDAGTVRSASVRAAGIVLIALPALVVFTASEMTRPKVGRPPGESRAASKGRPNVLFLTIDGVNARACSAYGYGKRTTPFLESIAPETLYCENAFSNSCRTYGSLVALLTGKLPTATRIIDPPSMLEGDARYEHLPGILRSHGYRTLQLTVQYHADAADANLLDAFDLSNYDWEMLRLKRVQYASDSARVFRLQMLDRIQDRLTRIYAGKDKNTFAFIVDTVPAPAPESYWRDAKRVETLLDFFDTSDEPWFAQVHLVDTHVGVTDLGYDTAIENADASVRTIVEALRASGKLDRTIVAIGSDHGYWWNAKERLPWMIRFPHGRHARRESRNVQAVDIAPTTLDALGLPIPVWMDGRSLLRPFSADRPIVSLCGYDARVHPDDAVRAAKLRVPNFGTASASIISGSWWYELDLGDGTLTSGAVIGHTLPSPAAPDASTSMLEQHLTAAGFRLPAPAAVRVSRWR